MNKKFTLTVYFLIVIISLCNCLPLILNIDNTNTSNDPIKSNYNLKNDNFKLDTKTLVIRSLTSKELKHRDKRQFDLSIEVEHEDGTGTDLLAESIFNLWKSKDGSAQIDGSAKYAHHFGEDNEHGKTKIGGKIHFRHV